MVHDILDTIPEEWRVLLKDELEAPYMKELCQFVEEEYRRYPNEIFPAKEDVFRALIQTPFSKVRVVLIGQDPYHGPNQAHGLSFSVKPGMKLPPSLKNIFKELAFDIGGEIPTSGSLLSWADQGVLLLNATLTVRKKAPMSHHKKGWERFTDSIVDAIVRHKKHVVFMLWGKNAQEKCVRIQEIVEQDHYLLEASHPSPYSAHRGFFGCHHFSKANAYLQQQGLTPISWLL